ncbi:HAD family hydrolase [Longimicrobium sp.]|uniref:HAD family hydrolase n=1 Tax=Longimicrobium sp. TaxID=2029185 RepID=UPI002BB7A7D5|nr:HAD hydrolase-like protein [Longimicrobium sp.]HSU17142.1 HAD hydrolase-like protein [Longimicrobium sp.]
MRRLVLFDIDGTLLSAGGAGKRAVHRALMEVFGTVGHIPGYSFAGRTDPEIVRDLLRSADIPDREIDAALPALWFRYVENLHREIHDARVDPLPGVAALLERIEHHHPEMVLGVLTGNIREGARIKVDAARLGFRRFRVGAFGSDHALRRELPAIAVERARVLNGVGYSGKEIVIIGDTPRDVECGEHLGVRTIAVATGHHPLDELAGTGADHVFADLGDVEKVWEAITG